MRKGKQNKLLDQFYDLYNQQDSNGINALYQKYEKNIRSASIFFFFCSPVPKHPEVTLVQNALYQDSGQLLTTVFRENKIFRTLDFEFMNVFLLRDNIDQPFLDFLTSTYQEKVYTHTTNIHEIGSFLDLIIEKPQLNTENLEKDIADFIIGSDNERFVESPLKKIKKHLKKEDAPVFFEHFFTHFKNTSLRDELKSTKDESLFMWLIQNLMEHQSNQQQIYERLFLCDGKEGDFITHCRNKSTDFKKHLAIAKLLKNGQYTPGMAIDADEFFFSMANADTEQSTTDNTEAHRVEPNNDLLNIELFPSQKTVIITNALKLLKIKVDDPLLNIEQTDEHIKINLYSYQQYFWIKLNQLTDDDSKQLFNTLCQWQRELMEQPIQYSKSIVEETN